MENKFWNENIGDLNTMAQEEANAFALHNLAADAVKETIDKIQANENGLQENTYDGAPVSEIDREIAPDLIDYIPNEPIDPSLEAQFIIAKYKAVFNHLIDEFEREMSECYNNQIGTPVVYDEEVEKTLSKSL
jgi:hypothetical protein